VLGRRIRTACPFDGLLVVPHGVVELALVERDLSLPVHGSGVLGIGLERSFEMHPCPGQVFPSLARRKKIGAAGTRAYVLRRIARQCV